MKKRLLSTMLALCLVLTMLPVNALATDEPPVETGTELQEEEPTTPENPTPVTSTEVTTDEQTTTPDSGGMSELENPSGDATNSRFSSSDSGNDQDEPMILSETEESARASVTESEIMASGTCGALGDNATWTLTIYGVLTISGTGEMRDYQIGSYSSGSPSTIDDPPWYPLRSRIKSIIIENGIQEIGSDSFQDCENLTKVTIPESVTVIRKSAFKNCKRLNSVTLPNSVKYIEEYVFCDCSSLVNITIPEKVQFILACTFYNCSNLTSVTIKNIETYSIVGSAFYGCNKLTDIYYAGSENDWKTWVEISGYDFLKNVKIHYGSAGTNSEGNKPTTPNENGSSTSEAYQTKETSIYLRPWIGSKTTDIKVNWGWGLFQNNATQKVNWQDLAVTGLCLSRAVEVSENDGRDLLRKLGFEHVDTKNWNFGEWNPAIAFGHKSLTLQNGKKQHIFAIVIRGTTDKGDLGADASLAINNGSVFVDNLNSQLEEFIEDFCRLNLNDITKNNAKFFVTGHSLGGAMANMISAQKLNKRYDASNVFAYTFASPKTTRDKSEAQNGTKNILNIINQEDGVTYVPKTLTGCRYGEDKEFHRDWYASVGFYDRFLELTGKEFNSGFLGIGGIDAHATDVYMAYLLTINHITRRNITLVTARCPVDAEIYDSNQQLVAKIKDNNVESIASEKMFIHIDNDEKLMYILDDDKYTIKLIGTDEGTMDYSVQNIDLIESKLINEKIFANVSLSAGKQMISYVNVEDEKAEGTDTSKVQLFVIDEHGNILKEVLPDGKGTEVPIRGNGENGGGSTWSNSSSNKPDNDLMSNIKNDTTEPSANITFTDDISFQNKKSPNTGD